MIRKKIISMVNKTIKLSIKEIILIGNNNTSINRGSFNELWACSTLYNYESTYL